MDNGKFRTTFQYLGFLPLAIIFFLGVIGQPSDDQIIRDFYLSLDSPGSWVWNTLLPSCNQSGISCTAAGSVSAVYVPSLSLNGTLPSSFAQLQSLQSLYLENNRLYGSLPTEWGSLLSLNKMALHLNRLSGRFPASGACCGVLHICLWRKTP